MIDKLNEIEYEGPQEATIQGPGEILKQARERAGFSTQDVADKIKLKKSLIEDIEKDTFDVNISLTFVRGYLKLYAKYVYVEETQILKAFESLCTQKEEPAKLQSFSGRVANQANDEKLMLVTYLVVTAVIALVVIWWFQQSSTNIKTELNGNNNSEAVTEVTSQEVLPIKDTLVSDSETGTLRSLDSDVTSGDSGKTTLEFVPPIIIEEQAIDNQTVSAKTGDYANNLIKSADIVDTTITETTASVELIFEFSDDCWMNLSDATGENIAYGVKVKGRIMPVSGIPPFEVTLGAPEAVKIRYAGEIIDMSFLPYGRIAKFDLPVSE